MRSWSLDLRGSPSVRIFFTVVPPLFSRYMKVQHLPLIGTSIFKVGAAFAAAEQTVPQQFMRGRKIPQSSSRSSVIVEKLAATLRRPYSIRKPCVQAKERVEGMGENLGNQVHGKTKPKPQTCRLNWRNPTDLTMRGVYFNVGL